MLIIEDKTIYPIEYYELFEKYRNGSIQPLDGYKSIMYPQPWCSGDINHSRISVLKNSSQNVDNDSNDKPKIFQKFKGSTLCCDKCNESVQYSYVYNKLDICEKCIDPKLLT